MLVRYKYRMYNGGRKGFFQCDVDDFKAFWAKKPLLVWCGVILQDGTAWWYNGKKWRKSNAKFIEAC